MVNLRFTHICSGFNLLLSVESGTLRALSQGIVPSFRKRMRSQNAQILSLALSLTVRNSSLLLKEGLGPCVSCRLPKRMNKRKMDLELYWTFLACVMELSSQTPEDRSFSTVFVGPDRSGEKSSGTNLVARRPDLKPFFDDLSFCVPLLKC